MVEFKAQIVKIQIKKDVTQSKSGILHLEFLPLDDLVDKLNRLMVVDEQVGVRIEK